MSDEIKSDAFKERRLPEYPFVVRDGHSWRLVGSYLSQEEANQVAERFSRETGYAHVVRLESR